VTTLLLEPPVKAPARPLRRDLPSLTGMRWAAALLVFGTHVRIFGYFGGDLAHSVQTALSPGSAGVSFFFILSGFVLTWTARPCDRATSFWRRRVARIYPLHLATAAVILVMAWTILPSAKPGPLAFVTNIFLVQSWSKDHSIYQGMNTVSWSLACEAFFYAMFPLLYWGIRRMNVRVLAVLAGICVLTVIALPILVGEQSFGAPLDFLPLARLPEFVLGMAMGAIMRQRPVRGPGALPAFAVLTAGYFMADNVPHEYRYAACTVIGFAMVIWAGAAADLHERRSLWRHPVMVRLGEVSYAFYMVHLLVMRGSEWLIGSHPRMELVPGITLSLTMLAIAVGVAWLFHMVVERPGQRLLLGRTRLFRRAVQPATAT
jgi:peptidoglycan/LPS O-acetylase OafA/YrhL